MLREDFNVSDLKFVLSSKRHESFILSSKRLAWKINMWQFPFCSKKCKKNVKKLKVFWVFLLVFSFLDFFWYQIRILRKILRRLVYRTYFYVTKTSENDPYNIKKNRFFFRLYVFEVFWLFTPWNGSFSCLLVLPIIKNNVFR